jgi:hypothetical protein
MYLSTLRSPILAIIFPEEDGYCNIEDRIPNNPYRFGGGRVRPGATATMPDLLGSLRKR